MAQGGSASFCSPFLFVVLVYFLAKMYFLSVLVLFIYFSMLAMFLNGDVQKRIENVFNIS